MELHNCIVRSVGGNPATLLTFVFLIIPAFQCPLSGQFVVVMWSSPAPAVDKMGPLERLRFERGNFRCGGRARSSARPHRGHCAPFGPRQLFHGEPCASLWTGAVRALVTSRTLVAPGTWSGTIPKLVYEQIGENYVQHGLCQSFPIKSASQTKTMRTPGLPVYLTPRSGNYSHGPHSLAP